MAYTSYGQGPQHFHSIANFYHRFIQGFSSIRHPLTLLLKGGSKRLAWNSKKLSPAKRNYSVGDHELLTVKLALEEWRHWLEGYQYPFTILMEHKKLEYLHTAKCLSSRQAHWSLFFNPFQFTPSYHPGSKNVKADALSRMHTSDSHQDLEETILPPEWVVGSIEWELDEAINNTPDNKYPSHAH